MDWYREQAQQNFYEMVGPIKSAMFPFRARDISVMITESKFGDIGDFKIVEIEVSNLPSWKFRHRLDMNELLSMSNPNGIFREIGEVAAKAFLSLERVEPDANHILGEN